MLKTGIVAAMMTLVTLLAGCSSITESRAKVARVVLSGDIPADLRIVTATAYGLYQDPTTGEVYRLPAAADTVVARPPFDETYDISTYGMFLVKVIAAEPDTLRFRLTVAIDGRTRYEQDLIMAADSAGTPGSLEWSYGL